jgi:hypothetical protein
MAAVAQRTAVLERQVAAEPVPAMTSRERWLAGQPARDRGEAARYAEYGQCAVRPEPELEASL